MRRPILEYCLDNVIKDYKVHEIAFSSLEVVLVYFINSITELLQKLSDVWICICHEPNVYSANFFTIVNDRTVCMVILNGDFITNGRTSMCKVWTESRCSSPLRQRDASRRRPDGLLDGSSMRASGHAYSLWASDGV